MPKIVSYTIKISSETLKENDIDKRLFKKSNCNQKSG